MPTSSLLTDTSYASEILPAVCVWKWIGIDVSAAVGVIIFVGKTVNDIHVVATAVDVFVDGMIIVGDLNLEVVVIKYFCSVDDDTGWAIDDNDFNCVNPLVDNFDNEIVDEFKVATVSIDVDCDTLPLCIGVVDIAMADGGINDVLNPAIPTEVFESGSADDSSNILVDICDAIGDCIFIVDRGFGVKAAVDNDKAKDDDTSTTSLQHVYL